MNRIYRLWKCGCYAFKLPVSKQLHGKDLPLTTTSAIIDLTIIAVIRKELQHGDCANKHGLPVVTHRPFFRALDFYLQQPAVGVTTCGTKEEWLRHIRRTHKPTAPSPIAISAHTGPYLRYSLQYKYTCHGNELFSLHI